MTWLPLFCSGHLDTVPLGGAPCSALAAGDVPGWIALLITAGRAEPTSNRALAGHKGALWLRLITEGITAHGSPPHLGENAIFKAMPALEFLKTFDPDARHQVMGAATVNLGTLRAGLNTNSVPDRCEMTLDLRSVPGLNHTDLLERVRIGTGITVEVITDLPAVWTDPDQPWLARTTETAALIAGAETAPAAAAYFTDASILTPAMNALPTVILGPGDAAMAHKTNEYMEISRLHEAVEIYARMLDDWQGSAQ